MAIESSEISVDSGPGPADLERPPRSRRIPSTAPRAEIPDIIDLRKVVAEAAAIVGLLHPAAVDRVAVEAADLAVAVEPMAEATAGNDLPSAR